MGVYSISESTDRNLLWETDFHCKTEFELFKKSVDILVINTSQYQWRYCKLKQKMLYESADD